MRKPATERNERLAALRDPRHFQIASLASLLVYGTLQLDLQVAAGRSALVLASALASQWLWTRRLRLQRFDPRSPLISGLSLCLLLRTGSATVAALTAAAAISSKFLIRWRGKHIFNPTNFGLVAAVLLTGEAWISPGRWGSTATFGFLAVCAGSLVVRRARRSDVTWAFLACYSGLVVARSAWLGDPLAIAFHTLENGALLVFAFFMISDPKTTPDSRRGRLLFAALVALGGAAVQFGLFRSSGPVWALAALSPLVPLIDRWLPAERYEWPTSPAPPRVRTTHSNRPIATEDAMTRTRHRPASALVLVAMLLLTGQPAAAFCGFYVAKADSRLFNDASQVVLVRDGDRTVLTMANDYRGSLEEFAVVIPVPTFSEREQIHVAEKALIDHLDAYTAPRLVEYFDSDPCWREESFRLLGRGNAPATAVPERQARAKALGVTIEASYSVGEYDILILSAQQSTGLLTWLRESGYRLPEGAEPVVGSYLKQGMRFFVARVDLEEQAKGGRAHLRPLQVAYESRKFMLPIRLGMVNADGAQELFVYTLTRRGRVETTNYRTVALPTGMDLPVFLEDPETFGRFYRDMFRRQVEKEDRQAVFLEYAWDMAWCDPCAADPLSREELRQLGVFWLELAAERSASPAQDVFVTRLHLRYDGAHFPDDLRFQQTADRSNFQGRYVLRRPWTGNSNCREAEAYRRSLGERREREAQQLASLTGWDVSDIRRRMELPQEEDAEGGEPWWRRLWKR